MTETAPQAPASAPIALVEPIVREGGDITMLTLRKPKAGELRGLKIGDLMNADVSAVIALLPRISQPFVSEQEAAAMASEDIAEAAGVICGFFLTPAQKAMVRQMTGG